MESFDMDFRVGGRQNSRFRYQGGPPITNHTVYQDIVPDERIVYAYSMTVDGERISASLTTVELRPADGGTELSFTEQEAFLDGHDGLESRRGGTEGLLDTWGSGSGPIRESACRSPAAPAGESARVFVERLVEATVRGDLGTRRA